MLVQVIYKLLELHWFIGMVRAPEQSAHFHLHFVIFLLYVHKQSRRDRPTKPCSPLWVTKDNITLPGITSVLFHKDIQTLKCLMIHQGK